MMKQIIISLVLLTVMVLLLMYSISVWSTENGYKGGGFNRRFMERSTLQAVDTLDIGHGTGYLAGQSRDHIYVGSHTGPRSIISVNAHTLDTQQLEFKILGKNTFTLPSIKVSVDSPYIYMSDGTVPVIYRGGLDSLQVRAQHVPAYFLDIVPIDTNTFIIKSLDNSNAATLGRLRLNPVSVFIKKDVLEKQIDGFFCTEGNMLFNHETSTLIYVYTYRNKFITLDSTLKITQTGKTIDTTEYAKIQVVKEASGNQVVLASPPRLANRKASIKNGLLYINSALIADNEDPFLFEKSSVIDVYDLDTGEYKGSFYIPKLANSKLTGFCVFDGAILALYGSKLIAFEFSERILSSSRSPPPEGPGK